MRKPRITALIGAAAMLLAGMVGVAPAMAADTATITVNAPASGSLDTTASAYRLATYADPVLSQDQSEVTSVDVRDVDETTGDWIKAALAAAGVTEDANWSHAGNLAKTTDAARLRMIARTLAESTAKPTPVVDAQTLTGATATLDVGSEGLYLVTADGSMPMIVSTLIDGKPMNGQNGTVTLKSTSVTVDKRMDGKDSGTGWIGERKNFTADFTIPAESLNPTVLTYVDTPKGMTIIRDSVTVSIDDTALDDVTPSFDANGVMTVDLSAKIAGNHGKPVRIAYTATLTAGNPSNNGTLTAVLDGDENTGVDEVTVRTFDLELRKTRVSDGSALAGAGFVIRQKDGQYMTWNPDAGSWSTKGDVTDDDMLVTGADGVIRFTGLAAGSYVVSERRVPDGMIQSVAPVVTVTISDTGEITLSDESDPNLTDVTEGVLAVRNVDSITQLPMTGGFQTATMAFAGVLVVMGASVLGVTAVRRMRANR